MINQLTIGWINYFGVAKANAKIQKIDSWIRRRLRSCIWKQWKKVKTRGRNLIKLGLPTHKAWEYANTRKGYWRISRSEEHTSELQSRQYLVCRLLLEKKKKDVYNTKMDIKRQEDH